jgi:hypothetical protein
MSGFFANPRVRSVLAIVTGFVFVFVLVGITDVALASAGLLPKPGAPVPDTSLLLFMILYVAVYAIAGCWLTARLAPDHPMRHALIGGALGQIVGIVGAMSTWNLTPLWYNVVGLATPMVYAWIGGRIREWQIERAAAPGHLAGA